MDRSARFHIIMTLPNRHALKRSLASLTDIDEKMIRGRGWLRKREKKVRRKDWNGNEN
jgi:hypothetical protein